MRTSGIYSITNATNNKIYYGSSNDCKHRWCQHKSLLNKNKHKNQHLQNAWNKYGKNNFIFNIEEEIHSENLFQIEQQYLDWIRIMPKNWFYNIGNDAKCWNRGMRGLPKHSKNHIKKISDANCGNKNPRFDSQNYLFQNKITKETFCGHKYDFYTKYNLNNSHICGLINGKRKSHKKWILISKNNE